MRTSMAVIILLFIKLTSQAQLPSKVMKGMWTNPSLFLDSIEVEMSALQALDPIGISNVTVVKPKKAKKLLGDKGKDGAIYVATVAFARLSYWNYLCGKSEEFKALFPSSLSDTSAQYILNGEVLSDKAATGSLFLLSDNSFKSLNILDKSDGKYHLDQVYPKRYIVVVTSKRQKGLVKINQKK